ncbi:unnamed protein product [Sphagnum jensenii]|uniref:Uncharacterized protein n=1 Tax=Sphagnum jensenii TaxID=128206 RepID=A0ABP0W5K4_9BRYO
MGPVKRKSDAGALRGKRRAENGKTFSTGEGRQQEDSSSSLSLLAAVVAAIRERTILLLPSSSSSAQCCFTFSVIFAHTNILTTVS